MSKAHAITERVCQVQRENPEMSAADLAERFGVDRTWINKLAKRRGLILPRGTWEYSYQPNKRSGK